MDRALELREPWFLFVPQRRFHPLNRAMAASGEGGGVGEKEKEEWIANPMEVEEFEETVDFVQDLNQRSRYPGIVLRDLDQRN